MAVLPHFQHVKPALAQKKDSKIRNFTIIAFAIYVIYMIIGYHLRNDSNTIIFYTDWAAVVVGSSMTLCLFYGAWQSRKVNRKIFLAWLMMASGQLCFTTGDFILAWHETVLNISPFPSLSDVGWLMT